MGDWVAGWPGGAGCADGRTDEAEARTNKRIRRRRTTKDGKGTGTRGRSTVPKNGAHMEDKRRECGADNAGPAACGAKRWYAGCGAWSARGVAEVL